MSYSKYKLHHVLLPPFLSTVNLQAGSLQFFSYDNENIRSYPISDPISFHDFFLVFDAGKLGKICRLHWRERLEIAKCESDTSSRSCKNLRIIARFWETAHIPLP